ncbi:MAG: hypothetical protein JNJ88_19280 [Planctomycetes bacterium]|nr:hypothetical protein [Planctomycetota bacterium]
MPRAAWWAAAIAALVLAAISLFVWLSWPHLPDPLSASERARELGRNRLRALLRAHGADASASVWRETESLRAVVLEDEWSRKQLSGAQLVLWPASDRLVLGSTDTLAFELRSLRYLASLPFKFADPGVVVAEMEPEPATGYPRLLIGFEPRPGAPEGDRYAAMIHPETGRLAALEYRPTEVFWPAGVRVRYRWIEGPRGLLLPESIVAYTVPFGLRTHSIRLRSWR